jgi:hypothetical protein
MTQYRAPETTEELPLRGPRTGRALSIEETSLRQIAKYLWLRPRANKGTGKGTPKNRETKEEPTMLLITKDRLWEPTMFMKTNNLVLICHDVYENKCVIGKPLSRWGLDAADYCARLYRAWKACARATQRTERSRNVIDNRSLLFLEFDQSRNVYENKAC